MKGDLTMIVQKSIRQISALFLGAAILGLSASAYAEGGMKDKKHHFDKKGHHERMLKKLDTNQDGKISKAEFLTESEKRFTEIDADANGELTSEEMQKHHEARREEMKKKFDKFKGKGGPDGRMPPPMDGPHGDMPPPPPEE
tara:strand:- start:580 stop:1005 length:426 start_codon:yes stop_codon:yes gene_type:complete